ncbi:MAG TPA: RCC1 repeat-containing protein, partial [Archangium sp.]|nr:RCC1 repeat-containing protein [Archangium sp.]
TTQRSTPVQVSGLSGVTALFAGLDHSVALRQDGTVWAWGGNSVGQLGDGTTTQRSTPAQVPGLTGVTALAVGGGHHLALRQDSTVWAWGFNQYGQLGDGTATHRPTPLQVPGLMGITALSASLGHSLAVREDGALWAWGENDHGQLGGGNIRYLHPTLVDASALPGLTAVAAGSFHSLALLGDGTVRAWGSNTSGQIGDGTDPSNPIPGPVPLP